MAKNTQPGLRDRAMQEALAALRQASPGISSALDAIAEQVKLSHPAASAPSGSVPQAARTPDGRMPQAAGFGEGEGTEGAELCETQDGHPAHTTKQAQTAPEQPASPAPQATRVTLAKEQRTALTREELVRSVVMAEVLGKPMALRRGGRVI